VLKRVIALEGDFVEVLSKEEVNGNDIFEKGVSMKMLRVPKGHVWLEGDNRPWSRDSRHYGPVPRAMVEGKAFAVRDARTSVLNLRAWHWIRGREEFTLLDET
jgi:mitochondrial inner membrane protease subunit 1